jgi:hypothetical protein
MKTKFEHQPDQEPNDPEKPQWLSYEELAAYLLNRLAKEFGLQSVEGRQKVQGKRSGTSWVIDAKGITEGGQGFFIVECKCYPDRRLNQEMAGGLAYRILDSGADGAILVSPMGFQEGATKIAGAERILSVQLSENCTPTDFAVQFLNKIYMGMRVVAKASVVFLPRLMRVCAKCGSAFPSEEHESLCSDCR